MEAEVEVDRATSNRAARPGAVGTNPEFMGLDRGSGLDPATVCLEGRFFHFHRLEAATPVQPSSSHRSTLYGRKHGSCQRFRGPPATACAQIVTEGTPAPACASPTMST